MIPPKQSVGWQFRDVAYPPRFSSLEAAQTAMRGDYSGAEDVFEEKDYGPPAGRKGVLREAYKNATYEMRYVSGKSTTLSVPSPE